MGCPKGFSLKGGMGAALLTQPEKVSRLEINILVDQIFKIQVQKVLKKIFRCGTSLQSLWLRSAREFQWPAKSDFFQTGRSIFDSPTKAESFSFCERYVRFCKIVFIQATLDLVSMIETTGVSALAVHGRTKEQRPNDPNDTEAIRKIVDHVTKIPVIANGGSSNNRNSGINTYEGLKQFWKDSGASSIMVAR